MMRKLLGFFGLAMAGDVAVYKHAYEVNKAARITAVICLDCANEIMESQANKIAELNALLQSATNDTPKQ